MDTTNERDRQDCVDGYVECAEWADWPTDEDGKEADDCTLTQDGINRLAVDMLAFLDDPAVAADVVDLEPAQVGHDFWLTRNGHGAGFWDRGLGEIGDRLTVAAHAYGLCAMSEYVEWSQS